MREVSPWTISLVDLPRTPGAQAPLSRDITLPERWGTDVAWLAAGSHVRLEGALDSVLDGVFVSATVTGSLTTACVRCLKETTEPIEERVDDLFLYPEALTRAKDEGDTEAEELPQVQGDAVDLEQVVRDAILAELPFSPLCEEDCEGLCPECGIPLADAEEGHGHEILDPRWSALGQLREDLGGQDTAR